MGTTRRQISPKLKFQIVLEVLQGQKTVALVVKAFGVHPVSVSLWKKTRIL